MRGKSALTVSRKKGALECVTHMEVVYADVAGANICPTAVSRKMTLNIFICK
jgi:hypothetical protein